MRRNTRLLGRKGEAVAEARMRREGYRILERNYRNAYGEIDLIAVEGETLVFVEVKSRRTGTYGPPEMAVDRKKQRRISRAALGYLTARGGASRPCRFDVVSVQGDAVDLIRNAFEFRE